MHNAVKSRIRISADAYGWDHSRHGREIYQKDGYEIYFFSQNDGFELTIRDPESQERRAVFEIRDEDIDTASPLYVAMLEHVLKNAEQIVSRCSERH
jgi:hypothetical protein